MVENVERHLHEGKRPFEAAIEAARELVGPIIAMTITLAAVYAPIGIQGGLTGTLFREFAFTLAAAVIVSGIVALTLSPMMGSQLLRAGDTERGFAGWINRRFDGVRSRYTRMLTATLRYRPVVLDALGDRRAADCPVLHVLAAGAGAGGRSGSRVRHHSGLGERHHRPDEALHRADPRRLPVDSRRARASSRSPLPSGGFGGMVTKPWSERTKTTQQMLMESMGPLSRSRAFA